MKAEQLTKIDNGTMSELRNATADMCTINDSLLLSNLCFRTLRYFFGENTCYLKLREAGRTSCWKNLCGTNLSINAGRNGTSEES